MKGFNCRQQEVHALGRCVCVTWLMWVTRSLSSALRASSPPSLRDKSTSSPWYSRPPASIRLTHMSCRETQTHHITSPEQARPRHKHLDRFTNSLTGSEGTKKLNLPHDQTNGHTLPELSMTSLNPPDCIQGPTETFNEPKGTKEFQHHPQHHPSWRLTAVNCSDSSLRTGVSGIPSVILIISSCPV